MGQNEQQADDQTRARLLETARAMVLRGDSKFSVSSLCAESGVERAVFRIHFSGKTALMAALMHLQPATATERPVATLVAQSAPEPDLLSQLIPEPMPEPVPEPVPVAVSAPAPEPILDPVAAAPVVVFQPVSKAEQTSEPGVSTPDAWLERRLRVFERALNALEAKADTSAREQARAIAQLQERLDSAPAATVAPPPVVSPVLPQLSTPFAAIVPLNVPQRRVELASVMHESEPAAQEMQAKVEIKPVPELPVLPPVPVATKEEMADVLQVARDKARAAVEPDAEPAPKRQRTRWLAVAAIAAVVLFLCVGLSLGKNFLGNDANAQPKSDGVTQRHQAGSVLAKTTALADAGNPRAQARLALAYLRGQGSAGDANAALLWSMSAAKAGDPVAQYLLGALYQQGDHVKTDPEQAFAWFTRAAEKGNLKAMHNLAIAYAHGEGTAKDETNAAVWFARAAERGYVDSAYDLAVLYERGIGVRQDLKQSLKWYGVAALAGDAPSKDRAHVLRGEMNAADVKLADAAAMAFSPLPALSEANNL
jgi:TPR repeat protein